MLKFCFLLFFLATEISSQTFNCPPENTVYTVQPGDNCWDLSQKFGVSFNDVMALNPSCGPTLQPNTLLCLPVPNSCPPWTNQYTVKLGDSCSQLAQDYNIPFDYIISLNPNCGTKLQIGEILCLGSPLPNPAMGTGFTPEANV